MRTNGEHLGKRLSRNNDSFSIWAEAFGYRETEYIQFMAVWVLIQSGKDFTKLLRQNCPEADYTLLKYQ